MVIVLYLSVGSTPLWADDDQNLLELNVEAPPADQKDRNKARPGETVLDEVEVTSERIETGQVDKAVTPAFYSVIDRDDFAGRLESVSDVVAKEAGVQVLQQGGLGSYSTVSLRGSSSDQVMVYLDGILLNDGSGGGVNLGNLSLNDVGSIEVFRGTTPANFSKASLGGVVNIKTLQAEEGFKASASAGYGSFNTYQLSAFVNHKPGRFDYLVSADRSASDNDFEIFNDNGTEYNPADDRYEKRNNAEFEQNNFLFKAGYDLSDKFRLDAMNQFFMKDQNLPSWNNSPRTDASLATKRNISTIRLKGDDLTGLHLNSYLRIDHLWQEEEYDDRNDGIGLGKQHNIYATNRTGAAFFVEMPTRYQTASLNLDFKYEDYQPDDLIKKVQPPSSDRTYFSAALQDSVFLFGERLIITPALRYTYILDHLQSAVNYWGVVQPGRDRQEDYFNPQIGFKFQALPWLAFKSNVAQYVREPNFYELFGDRGFLAPNEDLEAESGVNFDIGLEINLTPKLAHLDRFTARAAYFRSDVDDIITRVYDARGVGRSENISRAEIQGVEAQITLEFFKYFRFSGNATWQEATNHGDVKSANGKDLPGRWNQSYFCRLEFLYQGLKLFGEYQAQQGMFYDTANLLPAEDKNIFNLGLAYTWRGVTFNAEVRNAGDDSFEDFNGYPSAGRSYWASVSYRY